MSPADRRRMHASMAADVARRAGFPAGCPHAKRGMVTVCHGCLTSARIGAAVSGRFPAVRQ